MYHIGAYPADCFALVEYLVHAVPRTVEIFKLDVLLATTDIDPYRAVDQVNWDQVAHSCSINLPDLCALQICVKVLDFDWRHPQRAGSQLHDRLINLFNWLAISEGKYAHSKRDVSDSCW